MRLTRIAIAGIAALVLVVAPRAYAGDAFIVGGLQVHPTENIDASNRWLLSGGSDYHLSADSPILAGFEIQFAKYSEGDFSVAPFNLIANGKYKGPGDKIRPVIGGGGGLYSAWNWGKVGGFDIDRNWTKKGGVHGVFGVDIGEKNRHGLSVQVQVQHVFDSEVDTSWVVMGGLYF